jgi:ATP-dependent Clp protease, protease subunit
MYAKGTNRSKSLAISVGKNYTSEIHGHEEEHDMQNMMLTSMRHQEGTRYPMKCKVTIDPKVRIPAEVLQLPHVVQVRGDFTDEMAEDFAHAFNAAENTGQEVIPVVIDSYGGDIYALMSMIDVIQGASVPVATIVMGKAMSAGAVLLTCGTEGYRFAAPNSTIMVHSAWETGISGNADEVKVGADELMRLNKRLLEIMSKNCGHDKDYFHKQMTSKKNTDWYIQTKEALKHNFINHVRVPEFQVNVKMTVNFK